MNIEDICREIISCKLNCKGISNNPKKGILPRGLILESKKGKSKVIVVGLNPGISSKEERKCYLKNKNSYESIKKYWKENKKHSYYDNVRKLLSKLGFNGDILWTELVKCELHKKKTKIPVQTIRNCINNFLKKEIESFSDYVIFAVGKESFRICSFSFPKNFVIGIPHPNSRGQFFDLMNKGIKNNKRKYMKEIKAKKDDHGNYRVVELSYSSFL